MELDALVGSYGLYIDGTWHEPEAGRFDDMSPSTETVIASAPDGSTVQMEAAIGAARRAFDSGPWRRMSADDRGKCLTQLAEALTANAAPLADLARREWGVTDNEMGMHVGGPAFMAAAGAQLALTPAEVAEEIPGVGRTLLIREPLGVVSVLTPWNVPHTMNVMNIVAALAAGNTVVLKPSPLTPLAALALAKIIDEGTDIPPGVVNIVTTTSLEASQAMITDPRVDMISFTGSTMIGKEIMANAAGTMKRLLLECGGKSASIFLDDVDLDDVLPRTIVEGCAMHAGQACILHSRLLVPDHLRATVVERLAALANGVVVGDPLDPSSQMGPLISEAQRSRVEEHIAKAVADGAKVAAGGGRPAGLDRGFYVQPTILDNVDPRSNIAQEEVFGPVLCVIGYKDLDDAVTIANDSMYGLSGAVWGADLDRALGVARQIRTGQVAINGSGPRNAPFGGFKQSGFGRQGGVHGFNQFTEPKAIGVPS